MHFQFNYSTLRGLFDSFSNPDRERTVHVTNGTAKVQQRGSGRDARFYLRLKSGWSTVQYQRLTAAEMLELADALVEIAQPEETPT